ncbi:hypothetical protein C2857_000149 [Epichloe festucae Fl1]|uniref:Uncharacterized protein n=1 Tax=Epichloe festucae (strain Fl1) TaxID=877507 RepID=A0A7S9KK06_EPIFF|nr:hypothetical protein C2857_000149 [Epichloe festucae Fl1]
MGKDKKSAGKASPRRAEASAGRRHADQQARAEARAHAQHAAEFNEQLRRLQLHYAQVEQSVQQQQQQADDAASQAQAAHAAAATAAAAAATQQTARGQGGHRQARRQPTSPDFLDMLHNYVSNRTGREQRAWLHHHGLRGANPRQQPVYSLLPAAMRDGHERRLEADRQARIQQQEAAAEVVRRYQVTDASVDNNDDDDKQSEGKDDDDESKGTGM